MTNKNKSLAATSIEICVCLTTKTAKVARGAAGTYGANDGGGSEGTRLAPSHHSYKGGSNKIRLWADGQTVVVSGVG